MLARQAFIYSRRVLGSLQPVCCSASHMASQAAALRDEPHDSQASKKPLRKQIKRALEQMSAEQMEAESEQPAVCICWGHSRRLSLSRCLSYSMHKPTTMVLPLPVAGVPTHKTRPPSTAQQLCRQGVWLSLSIACDSVQAAKSAPGSWHSPCSSTLGGWACSCTAPASKRSTQSRWSRPRLQQVPRLSRPAAVTGWGAPAARLNVLLPHLPANAMPAAKQLEAGVSPACLMQRQSMSAALSDGGFGHV